MGAICRGGEFARGRLDVGASLRGGDLSRGRVVLGASCRRFQYHIVSDVQLVLMFRVHNCRVL